MFRFVLTFFVGKLGQINFLNGVMGYVLIYPWRIMSLTYDQICKRATHARLHPYLHRIHFPARVSLPFLSLRKISSKLVHRYESLIPLWGFMNEPFVEDIGKDVISHLYVLFPSKFQSLKWKVHQLPSSPRYHQEYNWNRRREWGFHQHPRWISRSI